MFGRFMVLQAEVPPNTVAPLSKGNPGNATIWFSHVLPSLGHLDLMRHCIYPGTFDPITNGHIDLVSRAGMRAVFTGFESVSREALIECNKKNRPGEYGDSSP